jgi:NTP pyrophosphatase (non-canonical NTP hydrolase)
MKFFNEYQTLAARTIPAGLTGDRLFLNAVLGCSSEAGELAGEYKNVAFQGHIFDQNKAIEELGDLLWYVAAVATALGITLDVVAVVNMAKLSLRYPDGFDPDRSVNRGE